MKLYLKILIVALLLAGCTQAAEPPAQEMSEAYPSEADHEATQASEGEPLQIVTTIFPQFDFVRQIAGDRVALTMLISPGMESHSFEPTPRDMVTLYSADLLIYVGGHSEAWVHPILSSLEREDMRTIALLDLVEGVFWEAEDHGHYDHSHDDHDHSHDDHDHSHDDHDHSHDDHDHSHDGPQLDEHVWTSPQNAILIVEMLAEILSEMDPENAGYFQSNAQAYIQELIALDQAITEVTSQSIHNTIVFGDRFPFRYLAYAYHLDYHAAFDGCSSETQASPARVASLIETVQAENIPVVFYIEFSDRAIANVIQEATGATLLKLHSAHNVSHEDFTAGITYLDIMSRNIEQLREALN